MSSYYDDRTVSIGLVRFAYPHCFEPYSFKGEPAKYSVTIIIPKSSEKTHGKICQAIEAAYKACVDKFKQPGGSVAPLSSLWTPLRDGDTEKPHESVYRNAYFINAKSDSKPVVRDADNKAIQDRGEIYSGCYGRANLTFFAFNNRSMGIGCALNGIQKTRDGERIGKLDEDAMFSSADTDDDIIV